MKHHHLLASLTVLVAATLGGCTSDNDNTEVINMLPKTRSVELTETQRDFVSRSNDFAFNLYRTLNEQELQGQSNIVSPLGVLFTMGMLHDGAAGTTAQEIASVLGFGAGNASVVNEFCQKLIDGIPNVDPSVSMKIANAIIANSGKGVKLASPFASDMKKYYAAETSQADFGNASFLKDVNGWCQKQTDGMVPYLLTDDELDEDAVVMLLNAISFKATWTEKFDTRDTQPGTFTAADGSTRQLPMMHRKAIALYGQNDIYSMLYLPYGTDRWGMMVLLPNEGKSTDDIVGSLSSSTWNDNWVNMWTPQVDISIPRFTTSTSAELTRPLSRMGAPTMFDRHKAEFPNVSDTPLASVWVGLMKQRAAIEVSEEGTKASAVTVAVLEGLMDPGPGGGVDERPSHVDFHCDRPFVYFIRESSSGAICFVGTFQGV